MAADVVVVLSVTCNGVVPEKVRVLLYRYENLDALQDQVNLKDIYFNQMSCSDKVDMTRRSVNKNGAHVFMNYK